MLLLDEPINGLDPAGIRWPRNLLTSLAREGRTVLLSSHVISELAMTADHLLVMGRGRLRADTSVAELTADGGSLVEAFSRLCCSLSCAWSVSGSSPWPTPRRPRRPRRGRSSTRRTTCWLASHFGQLAVGVLGVVAMTGEYSYGTIRSTLAVIPNRAILLAAKAAVFGVLILTVGETVTFATFLTGRQALTDDVPAPTLGDPGVLRAVALSGAYLAQIGLIGIGLGAITRHSAGAIGALVGLTFVLPLLAAGLTGATVAKYFPTLIAANSIAVAKPVSDTLAPWTGFGVLCLYTATSLAAGGWLLVRRDA